MLDLKEDYSFAPRETRWGSAQAGEMSCTVVAETPNAAGRIKTTHGELYYLNVRGTMPEMARQLGHRMAPQIHQGAVPFFARYLANILKNAPTQRASSILSWASHRWISKRLEANLPAEFLRAIYAMSDASDIDPKVVLKAYLMPETFLWVLGAYHKLMKTPRAPGLGSAPLFGCTSALMSEGKSGPLHARNFDYFGIGYWDKFSTVVFYHPDNGLDYVSVTSAGFLGGGITSMNAAGLTFVVHQHFVDDFDLSGVPVGVGGDYVMRHAHTIEEAVNILREHPPVAGWTYVMMEGDTGRGAVYEVAPGREQLHWMSPEQARMGYANVYWGAQFKDAEVDYYPEYRRCNYARQSRVQQQLNITSETNKTPDVMQMAHILGDMKDATGERDRLFGPTIAGVHTVASVVFDPANRRVWVGAGRSPTSRRWFIPFALNGNKDGGPDKSVEPFTAYPAWQDSAEGRSFDTYRQAAHRFWEGESDEQLLIMIEYALALCTKEPNLHILAGLLALRIDRGKRAEGAFRRALELLVDPARCMEVLLYLGWALDLQGQRSAAKKLYKQVSKDDHTDSVVKKRARLYRMRRFTVEHATLYPLDFIYGGVT